LPRPSFLDGPEFPARGLLPAPRRGSDARARMPGRRSEAPPRKVPVFPRPPAGNPAGPGRPRRPPGAPRPERIRAPGARPSEKTPRAGPRRAPGPRTQGGRGGRPARATCRGEATQATADGPGRRARGPSEADGPRALKQSPAPAPRSKGFKRGRGSGRSPGFERVTDPSLSDQARKRSQAHVSASVRV
jgi:hypothetical protein